MTPRKRRLVLVATLLALAVVVAWVLLSRRDPATWGLAPGEKVDASTTTLQVEVSPEGCTSGRVDDLSDADVKVYADRVVVTYTVAAPLGFSSAETCVGTVVHRTLTLPEPLGHRRLVDGTCPQYRRPAGVTECVVAHTP